MLHLKRNVDCVYVFLWISFTITWHSQKIYKWLALFIPHSLQQLPPFPWYCLCKGVIKNTFNIFPAEFRIWASWIPLCLTYSSPSLFPYIIYYIYIKIDKNTFMIPVLFLKLHPGSGWSNVKLEGIYRNNFFPDHIFFCKDSKLWNAPLLTNV